MLYLFRLLFFSINIDQETVLKWFGIGIEDPNTREVRQTVANGYDFNFSNVEPSTDVSIVTFRLIIQGLWDKIQDGLTLADIENLLFSFFLSVLLFLQ